MIVYPLQVSVKVLSLRYDAKCDVWSIGCILWDMSNHKDLFVYVSYIL